MQNLTPSEARKIAEEAYIYGFAIVENYKAIFGMCVYKDSPQYSGFNSYLHGRKLFDPDYKLVVSANNDTLYSTTFADLRTEPIVVSVPHTGDRYFVIQLVDMVTDNFAYIGTRATGTNGGDFALVGPSYKGALPAERFKQVIVCPSQFVALATRTAIDGPEDLAGVIEIQDSLTITPLSGFLKTPPSDPARDVQFPPYTPELYASPKLLELLNLLLQWHAPRLSEVDMMKRFASIHVGANLEFDYDSFAPELQEAIGEGTAAGHRRIEERGNKLGKTIDGWDYTPPMGNYGNDYLLRSAVAWKFIYTNSPEEALYPIANVDSEGLQLTGANNYVLHFPPGQLPPVEAFWSITMYHADTRLMVHNPIERYSIGDRTRGLEYGDDGSLTIYIQHQSPGATKESNWLPAPEGPFYLIARAYVPKEPMLSGAYRLPAVKMSR
jgi:hypothetical protein